MDFTEQMVLDNLICGLADEAIQTKVFAMNDKDITLSKVVKFMCWKNLPSGVCQILKQLELYQGSHHTKIHQRIPQIILS